MEASDTAQPLFQGQAPPAGRASPLKKKPKTNPKLCKSEKTWGFAFLFLLLAGRRLPGICQNSPFQTPSPFPSPREGCSLESAFFLRLLA